MKNKMNKILIATISIVIFSNLLILPKIRFVKKLPEVIGIDIKWRIEDNATGLYYKNGRKEYIWVETGRGIVAETKTLFHELGHWWAEGLLIDSWGEAVDD